MKDLFKSFTSPSDEAIEAAWKSDQTIFVFDTNVFLNLYGFEQQTRKDFFTTAQKIQEKVWIPFHVGLEFHNQRLNVISREKKIFQDLNDITERLLTKLRTDLAEHKLQTKFPKIQELSEQLISSVEHAVSDFKTNIEPWDKKQPGIRSSDEVLAKIYQITQDRTGNPPEDQKWLDDIYNEGQTRYERRIPPGFKDAGKDHINNTAPEFFHNNLRYLRKFGDLIIWKQIIDHASTTPIKNVFFITDDTKEDWWAIMKSSGSKVIGPLEALRTEIYSGSKVELFHMYSTSDFLSNAQKLLHIKVRESSINDAIKSQKRRFESHHLGTTPTFNVEFSKDSPLSPHEFPRMIITPEMGEKLGEQLRNYGFYHANPTYSQDHLSGMETLKETLQANSVQQQLNRLQEISNKELEKVLFRNQLLDSIRDSNPHLFNIEKGAEKDEDEQS